MATDQFASIILALLSAGVAGSVGAFALMKRTILAGDVMSHIAIPGLGLAVVWKLDPLLGGALTLFLGILIIWRLQEKSGLTTEAAIGVIFASSVAIGALLIESAEELIDALFGGFGGLTAAEFVFGAVVSVGVIAALWRLRHELILSLFSPDLAASAGVKVSRVNLWFLLLFGLAILVSLRFLGALLVGSLIIIPASAARQLTHSLGKFLILSVALAMLAMLLGLLNANYYGLEPGPTVVVTATAIFLLSLLKPKK
jgi:ABC-type Mn2+/Zn2+ transport system permease subunit